jgi:hypothetical protein
VLELCKSEAKRPLPRRRLAQEAATVHVWSLLLSARARWTLARRLYNALRRLIAGSTVVEIWTGYLLNALKPCEMSRDAHLAQSSGNVDRALNYGYLIRVHWLVWLVYSCCSHLEHRASVKRFVSIQFLNLRHSVGLFGRVISPSQGRYLTQTGINPNRHPCL